MWLHDTRLIRGRRIRRAGWIDTVVLAELNLLLDT
jgi:hypothetical protein